MCEDRRMDSFILRLFFQFLSCSDSLALVYPLCSNSKRHEGSLPTKSCRIPIWVFDCIQEAQKEAQYPFHPVHFDYRYTV